MRRVMLFLLLLCPMQTIDADIVHLRNDGQREGKILSTSDKEIVLQIERSGLKASVRIPADSVEKIERKATAREEFLHMIQHLGPDDASGFYEAGLWCEEKNLKDEAAFCFKKAIETDPQHEEAASKLPVVRIDAGWCEVPEVIARIDGLRGQGKHAEAIRLLEELVVLPIERLHSVLLKENLFKLARSYEAVGRWKDAEDTYDRILRCARLRNEVAQARARQEILKDHPDGKYECQHDPTLFKTAEEQQKAGLLGVQSLSRPEVMDLAVRGKANSILAEANRIVGIADDQAQFKPDEADKLYEKAHGIASQADYLIDNIARGLGLKIAVARAGILKKRAAALLNEIQKDPGFNCKDAYPGRERDADAYLDKTEKLCKLQAGRAEILRPFSAELSKEVGEAVADLDKANEIRDNAEKGLEQLRDEIQMEKLEARAAENEAKARAIEPRRGQYAYKAYKDSGGIYRFRDDGKEWRRRSDLCMMYCRRCLEANKKRLDLMRKYARKFAGAINGVKAQMIRVYNLEMQVLADYYKKGR